MRTFFSIALLLLSLSIGVNAQEIKMKSMEVLTNDLTARTKVRMDANGVECALIRIVIPAVKGMVFSGWVIGEAEYTPGEYLVYVPEGTKKIKFKHENYEPGQIVFTEPIVSKTVYRVVLELPDIEKVYVTESSARMAEGSRKFTQRDYTAAKDLYAKALSAKDVSDDMKPTLLSNIEQCDSCLRYEELTKAALFKISELKKAGNITQEQVADYYSAAAYYMRKCNNFNSCDYYSQMADKIEGVIANLPLNIRMTVTKWVVGRVGAEEKGALPNVEIFAYYGNVEPPLDSYSSDRKFVSSVSKDSDICRLIGITDENGVADLELSRKELPRGLFFRPNKSVKAKISYVSMEDVMARSRGEHRKQQFRQKIYVKE